MKKMLAISALAVLGLSANVLAGGLPEDMPMTPCAVSDAGVYFGISGGLGLTNYKQLETKGAINAHNDNHMVTRVFIGYDINRYFATEFGYTDFWGKASIKDGKTNKKLSMVQALDLFGKIKAPVLDNLNLYGKLGVSFLFGDEVRFSGSSYAIKHEENFNVAFGAGVDFAITPNIIVNAEWLRYNGNNHLKHYQPNADAFMLGLRYKFEI